MFKINAKLIRELLFERRLSLRQFALQAGLSKATVTKIVRDGATARSDVLSKVAKFFGVDGNELILRD